MRGLHGPRGRQEGC
eukprot:ctg_3474.g590